MTISCVQDGISNCMFLQIYKSSPKHSLCLTLVLKVMRCSKIASVKVSEITELVGKALENDKKVR